MDLSQKDKKLLEKIVQEYSLKLILLFGSQVSGNTHKESDYDVAYLSVRKLDLLEEANLIIDIAPIFKSENVDLVNLNASPPFLLYKITQECQVIYTHDALAFPSLRAYAFKKYVEEAKPLLEAKFSQLQFKIKNL